jgi:uncharacterized integral membrane protein
METVGQIKLICAQEENAMNARGVCPACGRTFETKVTNYVPSRFGKDFQCPLCKAWLVMDAKAKALFILVVYGVSMPVGIVTLVLIGKNITSEPVLFQKPGWHWLGPTLIFAVIGSIVGTGMWCGAWASSKVAKLKRVSKDRRNAHRE